MCSRQTDRHDCSRLLLLCHAHGTCGNIYKRDHISMLLFAFNGIENNLPHLYLFSLLDAFLVFIAGIVNPHPLAGSIHERALQMGCAMCF
jgi:hypothetical protein